MKKPLDVQITQCPQEVQEYINRLKKDIDTLLNASRKLEKKLELYEGDKDYWEKYP